MGRPRIQVAYMGQETPVPMLTDEQRAHQIATLMAGSQDMTKVADTVLQKTGFH